MRETSVDASSPDSIAKRTKSLVPDFSSTLKMAPATSAMKRRQTTEPADNQYIAGLRQ